MVKTYAYGFPRIGKNREYKKTIESFWKIPGLLNKTGLQCEQNKMLDIIDLTESCSAIAEQNASDKFFGTIDDLNNSIEAIGIEDKENENEKDSVEHATDCNNAEQIDLAKERGTSARKSKNREITDFFMPKTVDK